MRDPLHALQDDRRRIDRIVERLGVTDDLAERADLASELVRAVSRHEYVVETAVVPSIQSSMGTAAQERLITQRDDLRETMQYIHQRTQHLAARNAHAGDPQGLEDAIADVLVKVVDVLADEDLTIVRLVHDLDTPAKDALAADIDKASRHAAERPRPARTSFGRMISNIATKVDHALEDVATPEHPGADTIDG